MQINTSDLDYICQLVRDRTGVVLSKDKAYLVESRLALLAKETGIKSASTLIEQLKRQPYNPLKKSLLDAMMTNETFFFRDEYPFQALQAAIIPELIEQRKLDRTLNIWCAACSSGQEPYSIAMLLREHFPQLLGWTVNSIASDISESVLEQARNGFYTQQAIDRGLSPTLRDKYFHPAEKGWQVKADLRRSIEFKQLNLTEPFPSLPQMDIIFIRNVLIYFDIETKQSILAKIRRVLHPDGYLFLGGGETTVNLDNAFEPVQLEKTVCYRLRRSSIG
jgi:chemotaxis protein methyltransferase CheR